MFIGANRYWRFKLFETASQKWVVTNLDDAREEITLHSDEARGSVFWHRGNEEPEELPEEFLVAYNLWWLRNTLKIVFC